MAEKITQKQIYQHIQDVMADDQMVVDFCQKKIDQITNRKPSKRKVDPAVQERRDQVNEFLMNHGEPAAVKDIADALGYSSPQVTGAIRGLVNAGLVEVIDGGKTKQYKSVAQF